MVVPGSGHLDNLRRCNRQGAVGQNRVRGRIAVIVHGQQILSTCLHGCADGCIVAVHPGFAVICSVYVLVCQLTGGCIVIQIDISFARAFHLEGVYPVCAFRYGNDHGVITAQAGFTGKAYRNRLGKHTAELVHVGTGVPGAHIIPDIILSL